MITYRNYEPVASWDEKYAPIPGWGMNARLLAGGRMIAVGDDTVISSTPVISPPPPPKSSVSWTNILIAAGVAAAVVYFLSPKKRFAFANVTRGTREVIFGKMRRTRRKERRAKARRRARAINAMRRSAR